MAGLLKTGGTMMKPPPRGSVMLIRRAPRDWSHTGIVTGGDQNHVQTIEGNTNNEGSREGYEVAQRFRSYDSLDFIQFTL